MSDTTFVLGGIKSGKSRLAEQIAKQSGKKVIYIATARAGDNEMQQRIQHHRAQRPDEWMLVEEPINLAHSLLKNDKDDHCILLDCLTLWLTNLLMLEDEEKLKAEKQQLLQTLPKLRSQIILVSNETSMGIVPLGELTRRFCDEAGLLHQSIASISDKVILTIAGLPHYLKGSIE